MATYIGTSSELADRIYALIESQPQILKLETPWGLFKVPGFKCDDLQPSMHQAGWALRNAQARWRKEHSL